MLVPLCLLTVFAMVAAQNAGTIVSKGSSNNPIKYVIRTSIDDECHAEYHKDQLICKLENELPLKLIVEVLDELKYPTVKISDSLDAVLVKRSADDDGFCPGKADVKISGVCPHLH